MRLLFRSIGPNHNPIRRCSHARSLFFVKLFCFTACSSCGKVFFLRYYCTAIFRRFLHKMMKDFLRQHRTIKAAALCGNFMSWLCCDFTVIHQVLPQNRALSARKICSQIALVQLCGIALRQCKYIAWFCLSTDVLCREIDISGSHPCIWQSKEI